MLSQNVPTMWKQHALRMELPVTTPNSLNATSMVEYIEKTVTNIGGKPLGDLDLADTWINGTFWDKESDTPFVPELTTMLGELNIVETDEDDEDFEDEGAIEEISDMLLLYIAYG